MLALFLRVDFYEKSLNHDGEPLQLTSFIALHLTGVQALVFYMLARAKLPGPGQYRIEFWLGYDLCLTCLYAPVVLFFLRLQQDRGCYDCLEQEAMQDL